MNNIVKKRITIPLVCFLLIGCSSTNDSSTTKNENNSKENKTEEKVSSAKSKDTESNSSENTSDLFDKSGRAYSNQGSDIDQALNNFSNQNHLGFGFLNESHGQKEDKNVTIWNVYKDDQDTDLIVITMSDQATGEFNGLNCCSTEEGQVPNIESADVVDLYKGIIGFTDANLEYEELDGIVNNALDGEYEKNNRVYLVTTESNTLSFMIICN